MAFKQRVFSGVQPTGNLHLGNYLGAIVKFVALQERYDCIYCIVDLHAITVWQDPAELPKTTREVAAAFIACGIDPKKHIVFNQSQVAEHAELAWVFNCVARLGWLNRMTQFKEKAGKDRENASVGLYAYPTLMAADILAYRATHVPVGEDQKQHLELSRDIAQKFNNDFAASIHAHGYGESFFPLPEPLIQGPATRVMSLRDGSKKMSKSDASDQSRINLTDDADTIAHKIRRAKTDPDPLPREEKGLDARPEADNLVGIYAALAGKQQSRRPQGVRRRAILDLQGRPGRARGRKARPDQCRDEAVDRRSGLYRSRACRGRCARASHRRRNNEGGQGHRRLRAPLTAIAGTIALRACGTCTAAERRGRISPMRCADRRRSRATGKGDEEEAPQLRGRPFAEISRRHRRFAGMRPRALFRQPPRAADRRNGSDAAGDRDDDHGQQWLGVADIMRAEAHEEANAVLDRHAARSASITGVMPQRVIREGDKAQELLALIEDDEDIAVLVLAAGDRKGRAGPARVRSRSRTAGEFPIPVAIVPGNLSDEDLDSMS